MSFEQIAHGPHPCMNCVSNNIPGILFNQDPRSTLKSKTSPSPEIVPFIKDLILKKIWVKQRGHVTTYTDEFLEFATDESNTNEHLKYERPIYL
jgi:hypothetical protein